MLQSSFGPRQRTTGGQLAQGARQRGTQTLVLITMSSVLDLGRIVPGFHDRAAALALRFVLRKLELRLHNNLDAPDLVERVPLLHHRPRQRA